jgi:hypothetical protein
MIALRAAAERATTQRQRIGRSHRFVIFAPVSRQGPVFLAAWLTCDISLTAGYGDFII